jgi:hypothetical protein
MRDVGNHDDGLASQGFDFGGDRLDLSHASAWVLGKNEVGPSLSETERDGAPDALRSPGHDGNFILESKTRVIQRTYSSSIKDNCEMAERIAKIGSESVAFGEITIAHRAWTGSIIHHPAVWSQALFFGLKYTYWPVWGGLKR